MHNQNTKRLYRSENNKVISGIFGGLGEYFEVDPVIFRLVYLLVTIFTGVIPGVIAYILAVLIVPKRSQVIHEESIHTKSEQTHSPKENDTEPSSRDDAPIAS